MCDRYFSSCPLGKRFNCVHSEAVLAKGMAFFTLPIYMRIFTPAYYGIIEMMVTIVSLLSSILVMGMDSAQSFYFFEQKTNGLKAQAVVVSSILQWRLL